MQMSGSDYGENRMEVRTPSALPQLFKLVEAILCTNYIETFVIPLHKLQSSFQEKLKALYTEEESKGLFDFSIASKAPSNEILLQ
ncbi:hypothetical protein TNCV_4866241 [Trichonephila clavipes]|nr:hypothetical protein TNCV_4866241 [Trichonephila clavipes]